MKIIATIPPPVNANVLAVAKHPLVSEARFNTGSHGKSPFKPEENLEYLKKAMGEKKLYVDLKGKQLRVSRWASPIHGTIILNRAIEVDFPAELWLRGEKRPLIIREIRGRKVYTESNPEYAAGAGQAANVIGTNLKVHGKALTQLDREYIVAARRLGIHDFMLSYTEQGLDIEAVLEVNPDAEVTAKIESTVGVGFISSPEFEKHYPRTRLMAARDDLAVETGVKGIFEALKSIIKADPDAIVASRMLESLFSSEQVSLPDLSDIRLMQNYGYRNFMLSDGICSQAIVFGRAMRFFETYI
jgi:pyruvate kinase